MTNEEHPLGLPPYNEAKFLRRAERFAQLMQLNAPIIILLNEYKMITQAMLAAIGEETMRKPERATTQESATQEPNILNRLFRRKS